MSLIEKKEELKDELEDHFAVIAERYPAKDIGDVFEAAESCYQAYACCALLVDADVVKYQERLLWSAMARRSYLKRCVVEANQDDLRRALSRSAAIFSGLAAGDIALAVEVCDLSATAHEPRGEYPDDFAYHRLLHAMLKNADDTALGALLSDYEAAMDGIAPQDRLEVCAALVSRDAAAFVAAFDSLVAAYASEMDEERPFNEEKPDFEPRSRLFIEGLGLLRIADVRHVPVAPRERLPLIPALALVDPLGARPQDPFSMI
jgi:hypothetical protein